MYSYLPLAALTHDISPVLSATAHRFYVQQLSEDILKH